MHGIEQIGPKEVRMGKAATRSLDVPFTASQTKLLKENLPRKSSREGRRDGHLVSPLMAVAYNRYTFKYTSLLNSYTIWQQV